MEIYVEYVIFDNFIINLLIVIFTGFLLDRRYKKFNIFIADCFGTTCAVLLPLVSINASFLFGFKLIAGIIFVGLLKKYSGLREYFTTFFVFLTVTFLFGGICYGVNAMFGFSLSNGQVLINNYAFPVSLFCAVASGYLFLLVWLIKYLRIRNKLSNLYFDVTIKLNGKLHFLRGFLDTGNKLKYRDSNIVLVPRKVFLREFNEFSINELILKPNKMLVKAVSGFEEIVVLDIDEINVKNNEKNITMQNVKIGLSEADFSSDFDCLLGGNICMGER